MLDVTSTWLAVGHLGSLAFLYNAVLSGRLTFDEPQRQLACIFIAGAASAFLAKTLSALYFINGVWPYRQAVIWFTLVGAGFGLLVGISGPLMYDWVN